MPPIDGTNSIPAGMIDARTCASWPAPLGIRNDLPSASSALAGSIAGVEIATKIAWYYVHERVWAVVPFGRRA